VQVAVASSAVLIEFVRVKKVTRSLLIILALLLSPALPVRADLTWSTDFKKAQEQAKTDKKLILVDFTGSDWCGWCIRLNKEVFSQPEFKDYATKNLVLVEVDFPRAKPQSSTVVHQNEELAERFGIQGFPTIIVLDGEGKKVGELGYMPGGPSAFIEQLERLRKG
jgi:protein disulfide-isomerase